MHVKFFSMWAAAAVISVMFTAPARAREPIRIKFSHVVTDTAPKGRGALKFKELAEKALPGRVIVEVYANSSLYKDKEELEALQLGSVQMLAPGLEKFAPVGVREFEVFNIPYLLPNQAAVTKITEGPIGRRLLDKLEPKGFKGLGYWDNGFKMFSANKPLRVPDDVKGLKMRIQSSRVVEAYIRRLGALPQVMSFSELYQALQTGVVDGCENPPSSMLTQKFDEVQKYTTITNHAHLGYVLVVQKKFWDSLPDDVRPALDKAAADATHFTNSIAEKDNADALAEMKKSGKTQFIELTAEQKALWVTALSGVREEAAKRVGAEIIAEIDAALK